MKQHRWIIYLHHPMGSFDVRREYSLSDCKRALRLYARDTFTYEQASASLYAYSEEAWSEAKEYEDVGCPFDCPDKLIEFGPKGGIRVTNA